MSDYETVDSLESFGVIEIYENEVMLSEQLVRLLESHLIEGYDEDLYDYANIFEKIERSIGLYYKSTESNGDSQRHLKEIHRELRRMPNNLLDSLRSIQRHVEFAYRSAADPTEKVQELSGYSKSLDRFDATLFFIRNELKRHSGFFNHVDEPTLNTQRIRLSEYIRNIYDTLISITQSVIEYIRRTNENILFHKHIVELKELRDRRAMSEETNLYELLRYPEKFPLVAGLSKIEKQNLQIKLYPDYAYESEFERRLAGRQDALLNLGKAEVLNVPISDEMLCSDKVSIANYAGILDDYLAKDGSQETFLAYLCKRKPELSGIELLEAYMSTIIFGAESLTFIDGQYEQIGNYDCIATLPLQHHTPKDYL